MFSTYKANYVQYFTTTVFLVSISTVTGEIEAVSEMKSCSLKNTDVWSIYYGHFITSRLIVVKVLTCNGSQQQNDVTDFANSLVQTLNYLDLPQILQYFTNDEKLSSINESKNVNIKKKTTNRKKNSSKRESGFRPFLNESKELGIIVVRDEDCIMNFIENTDKRNIFKKVQMRYIIVLTRSGSESNLYIKKMSHVLVKLWTDALILNAFANAPCSYNSDYFYIYRPFKKFQKERGIIEIATTDRIANGQVMLLNEAKNLHGASLKVSLFERNVSLLFNQPEYLKYSPIYGGKNKPKYYGPDGMVLQEISKYMNFTIDIDDTNTYFGTTLNNRSVTGSLGKVVRKEVDFAGNSRFIEYYHPDFEYTNPVYSDKLCVIVPSSPKMSKFLTFLLSFDTFSWIGIFGTVFVCIVYWYLHKYVTNIQFGSFLEIYAILLGESITIPKIFRVPLLIIVCSFANIIFSSLFQANLYNHFSKANYHSNIDTLEQLSQSNLTISTSLKIFDDLDSDTYRALRLKVINTAGSSFHEVAFHRNTANLERLSDAKAIIKQFYFDEEGHSRLYVVKECLSNYLLAYILQEHSPYRYYFNHVLVRLTEGGFLKKWNEDISQAFNIAAWNSSRKKQEIIWRKLNNNDMQIAYIVLITGYVVSFLCFLKEILLN